MTREEQRRGVGGEVSHEWGETDVDWCSTRVCLRCGVIHKWDHVDRGFDRPVETYTFGSRTSPVDPGCIDDDGCWRCNPPPLKVGQVTTMTARVRIVGVGLGPDGEHVDVEFNDQGARVPAAWLAR